MVTRFLTILCFAVLILTACSAETQKSDYDEQPAPAESRVNGADNVAIINPVAQEYVLDDLATFEPFTEYTFKYSDRGDKYIISIIQSGDGRSLVLDVENNSFNIRTTYIEAPERYMLNIPRSASQSAKICEIITNTVDDSPFTDILRFEFYLSDFSDPSYDYTVSRFFAMKNGRIEEIGIIDKTGDEERALPYTPENLLLHTEINVLMPPPIVSEDENGRITASVSAYTIDTDAMTMTKSNIDSSGANTRYYGYACHAAAIEAYRYFAGDNLNITDYVNYMEISVSGSDKSDYFFKADDPRFPDTEALKNYVRKYFSENIVEEMFLTAPQRYRDIDGELYTLNETRAQNASLGRQTITGWSIGLDSVTYSTKQEKLDERGGFIEFINGGDFAVTHTEAGFIVTQFRYPY